jgi:hypothetical protein
VIVANVMSLELLNRQLPESDPLRVQMEQFKAPPFNSVHKADFVRVVYSDVRGPAVGFGMCVAFFQDAQGDLHVGVWWCVNSNRAQIDRVAKMHKVVLGHYDVLWLSHCRQVFRTSPNSTLSCRANGRRND